MSKVRLVGNKGFYDVDEDKVFMDNFIAPYSNNPYNVRLFVIGHEFGPVCATWAIGIQEALDSVLDHNLECFLVHAETLNEMTEEEREELAYLGNASEPCDLSYAWFDEITLNMGNKEGFNLMHKMLIAEERGEDTLDFYI